uniref:Myb-like domain-containing protein n=2 Tax=Solanum tuberosum TaxID=4113 RepID=M1BVW3_SOLTU
MNIKEGNNQHMNVTNSCSGNNNNNNNNSIGGRDSSSSPTNFQQNQVSMDWTPEEQATLEEGLVKYASETSISRYAKIAIALKNKTVRDVALRCKWTTKKENSRRRKDDANLLKKNKDRKEKLIDPTAVSSPVVMQQPSYAPYTQGVVSNKSEGFASYHEFCSLQPHSLFIKTPGSSNKFLQILLHIKYTRILDFCVKLEITSSRFYIS